MWEEALRCVTILAAATGTFGHALVKAPKIGLAGHSLVRSFGRGLNPLPSRRGALLGSNTSVGTRDGLLKVSVDQCIELGAVLLSQRSSAITVQQLFDAPAALVVACRWLFRHENQFGNEVQ
jgi:hypothetical protein